MNEEQTVGAMLADKRTSRREFLAGATALGISVAAASTMWSKAAKASPKKGGHLIAALVGGSTTDNMDQQTWTDTFMISIARATRAYARCVSERVSPHRSGRSGHAIQQRA
jgi:hypothetical protein